MNVLILTDSFKHCLSSLEVAGALEKGILKANPNASVVKVPVADGGEGTVDAFVSATNGRKVNCEVQDPLLRKVTGFYGILPDGTAVIEMAAASGIEYLTQEERNPLITSTFGVGELILAAIEGGAKNIIVGLGSSATNDGGAGMAKALGYKFLDSDGNELGQGGGALSNLVEIDASEVNPKLEGVKIVAACDVTNPLCGKEGASAVYGPQKGATPEMIPLLDENLNLLSKIIKRDLAKDVLLIPGAGAAGGLGAGIVAFANGELIPGFEIIKDTLSLEEKVQWSDIILTGEGRMDEQTKNGKTPFSVAQLGKKYNKKVIAFAGSLGRNVEALYNEGFASVFPISPGPLSLEESLEDASTNLNAAAERVFRLLM